MTNSPVRRPLKASQGKCVRVVACAVDVTPIRHIGQAPASPGQLAGGGLGKPHLHQRHINFSLARHLYWLACRVQLCFGILNSPVMKPFGDRRREGGSYPQSTVTSWAEKTSCSEK